jgi:ISXO2-like transposase domain
MPNVGLTGARAYKQLRHDYLDHKIINHSAGLYVRGDTYTNTIEGAFGNMKTGMRGAYKKVSPRYLQSYLDECAWRHNAKRNAEPLFEQLLKRATTVG